MALLKRGLLYVLTAGTLAVPTHLPPGTPSNVPPTKGDEATIGAVGSASTMYKPTDMEFYLTSDQVGYIRPGVKLTITSFTNFGAGKKPVVEFTLTDNLNQPLDRLGQVTPGPIAPGFVLAKWDPATREYKSYTNRIRNGVSQPSADQGGTYTDVAIGSYKYTFGTTMPADLDAAATTTLGAYARRTMTDIIGKDYYADNVFKDVRADGAAVTNTYGGFVEAVQCNNCHNPLGLHGGTRRTVKMCMLCHNSSIAPDQTSGNTFDGKVFFHKLHFGPNLPSVKAGKPYIAGGDWSGVTYPQNMANCANCHAAPAPEASIWYSRPTRKVCGSCHDDINWTTGAAHPAGPQVDDSKCADCHAPQGDMEFDASIKGAHTVPEKSAQLKGLKVTIVSVENVGAGKKPTVTFKVTNGDGTTVDANTLTSFSPKLGGSTTDYGKYFSETATGKLVLSGSTAAYTFTNAIPADAKGTWVVSADVYRNVNLKRGDGKADIVLRECATNPVTYVGVTDAVPVPRRIVVDMALCNKCHDRLALHGGQRLVIDECVLCHNPNESDVTRRPASAGAPESVSFQRMIHRIHTGEETRQNYTVYGFGGSVNDFSEVTFPGDRRDCSKCHVGTTYNPPVPVGTLAVQTPRDFFTPQGTVTASCLGCHDGRDQAAHAYLNTAPFGEACATCHGANSEWGPSQAHAR